MKKYINTIIIGTIAIGTEVTEKMIGERWDSFLKDGYIIEAPEKVVNEAKDCDYLALQDEIETLKGQLQASKNEDTMTQKDLRAKYPKQTIEDGKDG